MVVFPSEFAATEWPGNFWNIKTKEMYSIKTGVLKKLAKRKPFNGHAKDGRRVNVSEGYVLSVSGERVPVPLVYANGTGRTSGYTNGVITHTTMHRFSESNQMEFQQTHHLQFLASFLMS